jgi:DNA polymerase-3 subunit gamma/tau
MIQTALARKYRPTRFADLVAQEHVAAGLAGAVARNRVAHAYLLTGPRGVGKTTAARVLAMALNCPNRDAAGEPCGTCDSCSRIWAGTANLDVVEIDAASNRGVDDARDLRERAMYAASGPDRFKVYIVDEAHMLTREAWNALLKILEEPPPRVVFVFATTEPQKIANTAAPVLSRVQRFDFKRIGPQAILARLKQVVAAEKLKVNDDALTMLARSAAGGMRDALSLLDQVVAFADGAVSADLVRTTLGLIGDELYAELLDLIGAQQPAGVFPFVDKVVEGGADLEEFVNGAGETLRALMERILGGQPAGLTESLKSAIDRHAARLRPGDVIRMLKLLRDAEQAIRRSPNARLHVETLILQWTLLDRTGRPPRAAVRRTSLAARRPTPLRPRAAMLPPRATRHRPRRPRHARRRPVGKGFSPRGPPLWRRWPSGSACWRRRSRTPPRAQSPMAS